MKATSIIMVLFLLIISCRKDEITTEEYYEVKVKVEDTTILKKAEATISNNKEIVISNKETGEEIFIVTKGNLRIGINEIKELKISFLSVDLENSKNLILELKDYRDSEGNIAGMISGSHKQGEKEIPLNIDFKCRLFDDVVDITGKIWYDAISNDLLDADENGVNGMSIEMKSENLYSCTTTTATWNPIFDDGYFRFKASKIHPNTISIKMLAPSLKMVMPRKGSDPKKFSHFDLNGKIENFIVETGNTHFIGGVTPK